MKGESNVSDLRVNPNDQEEKRERGRTPDLGVELAPPANLLERLPPQCVIGREAHLARRPVRLGRPRERANDVFYSTFARSAEADLVHGGGGGERAEGARAGEPGWEGRAPPGPNAFPQQEADVRIVDSARQGVFDLFAAFRQQTDLRMSVPPTQAGGCDKGPVTAGTHLGNGLV